VPCSVALASYTAIIGRAGASPPNRSAGACSSVMRHFGPRWPSRYGQTYSRLDHIQLLGKVGKDRVSWTFLPVAFVSDSQFRLPLSLTSSTLKGQLRFATSGNYRSRRRRYTRQGLPICSLGPTLGTV